MVTGHACTIRASIDIVRKERSKTVSERNAFDEFAKAVNSFDAAPLNQKPIQTRSLLENPRQTDTHKIRQAYRESVMDVQHYEEEYNETLVVNLTAEFGPKIASAIVNANPITSQLQQAITTAAKVAKKERADHVATLDTEQAELKEARQNISELEEVLTSNINGQYYQKSYNTLREAYHQLIEAESQCRVILQDRQRQRQTGHTKVRSESVPDLQTYLYQDLEITYPVLSDTLHLYEDLRSCRSRIEYWLARID